jgi:ribosomal protein S18 acetylase RimI-like enzyme
MKKLPVTIRQADHHNARLLSELAIEFQVAAFGHSFRADDLTAHLAQHLSVEKIAQMLKEDVFLVAETGDRMAGFVQFGREYSNTDEAVRYDYESRRLYVHAAFQNRGICGRLMETALGHPTMRHAAQITLDVWEHNPAAVLCAIRIRSDRRARICRGIGRRNQLGFDHGAPRGSIQGSRITQTARLLE